MYSSPILMMEKLVHPLMYVRTHAKLSGELIDVFQLGKDRCQLRLLTRISLRLCLTYDNEVNQCNI